MLVHTLALLLFFLQEYFIYHIVKGMMEVTALHFFVVLTSLGLMRTIFVYTYAASTPCLSL